MHLISLELQGFKSFPDKVKLDFGKGITGVVGPNGSGKSNIGDAMRWVLGEQSTKTLRGGKMEDVIFTGTEKRKAVGFAMATLNIDNTDHSLNFDADIVSVTRKLYRNGDSEYIINSEQVRLKDVLELFMDTGLGRDGYSIIGQGKIAEIVSSKSSDRREIFEEAAGISKFRYKKLQAERKLVAAEDNILRLTDIIGELEGRIEPLRVQSEKAKKFKLLDDEKQGLEISVWVFRLEELKKSAAQLEERLADVTAQYDVNSSEAQQLENDIEENLMKAAQCADDIEKLRENIHTVELENTQSQADIAVLENDIVHIGETVENIKRQIEQSYTSADRLEEQRLQKLEEAKETQAQTAEIDKSIAQRENELNALSERDSKAEKAAAEKSGEISALYIRASELAFILENSKNVSADVSEQSEALISAKNETEQASEEASKERKEIRIALANLEGQLAEHTNRLNGYTMLSGTKSTDMQTQQTAFAKCDNELSEKRQRLKILNDLENSMEGFASSVQRVIKASKQGRISGILGSVAQLVTTKQEYSIAIETALGGSLQNVVVENEDCAKRCIRFLKEENAGRATFLPITSVKGKPFTENGLDLCDGYVAMANELVSNDSRLDGIVSSLLGRTAVAENLDCAVLIAKKYGYRFRIVTLDGQVINAGGSFTGGSASRTTGILTRKHQIEQLEKDISQLNIKRDELSKKLTRLKQELDKLSADSEAERDTISEMNTDKVRFEGEIKRLSEIISQYDSRLDEIDAQLSSMATRLEASENEFDEASEELSKVKQSIADKENELERTQQAAADSRAEREDMSQTLSQLRLRRVELVKDTESFIAAAAQIQDTISALSGDRTSLENQLTAQLQSIDGKREQIEEIKQAMSGSGERIAAINLQITQKQDMHKQLDELSARQRGLLKIKNDTRETLSQEVARATEKRSSVQDEYDKLVSSLWEQYELSRSEAAERCVEISDIAEAEKRLTELRNKIKHLGSVNLGAIEEYREVSERYGFLSAQLKDVTSSKSELEKLISQLTADMRQIFTESFSKINESFKKIFVELFGGGKAELVLDNPDDVLECGIDIRVAPPGKVIKNLSLLSGGEQAFVAISIYFAILSVKPSPFCLLDEIEAALDDVNVTKYAQYLRKFTDTTQFIAITHRRGTMEESDVLYGVTMQEKGVSKLLKMDVSQAEQTVNALS